MDFKVKRTDKAVFSNYALNCVGTGRMHLALRHEYHKQLQKVQDEIGFKYIRGHGLFHDDVGIYQTYEEDGVQKVEYNFTYVDMIIDDYLSLGLKPFIELGFMPKALASGEQTVFYWEGNVTPPSDYEKWADLVIATVSHWIERYGEEEVLSWPMEVWNEPNLEVFWENADMDEYFKLYEVSARAVKKVNPKIRVGGPSICGVEDEHWLKSFLEFTSKNDVPLDFVTRHCYATEPADYIPHYAYQKLSSLSYIPDELRVSRDIIDSFPAYRGMEMHITEFNTSYSPRNPLHDTNLNAAYIAYLLSVMGDTCASYSYWTFGDVFEEQGIAFTPFSGCFGLLTNGSIPKPTYWTYEFFSKIGTDAVSRGKSHIITKEKSKINDDEIFHIVAWNPVDGEDKTCLKLNFSIEATDGEYYIFSRLVDEDVCNPLKSWIDMGSPPTLNKKQLSQLKDCATPAISTQRLSVEAGLLELDVKLNANAICHYEVVKVNPQVDRGFIAERVQGSR
ncbi:MAG: xylan 1,4-beta-xylosidase [Oscillospiraceae bacterium]|nr:xylan 1,4-beta-xylosidase [Oscillospiraceae bacterium]